MGLCVVYRHTLFICADCGCFSLGSDEMRTKNWKWKLRESGGKAKAYNIEEKIK
jgi:hypothetical protein